MQTNCRPNRIRLLALLALVVSGWTLAQAASPPGDVVGKITVGYQGCFACVGDSALNETAAKAFDGLTSTIRLDGNQWALYASE